MNQEKKHQQDNTGNDPSDTSIGHQYNPGDETDKADKKSDNNKESNPRKDVETLKQEDSSQTNKNDLIPPTQA